MRGSWRWEVGGRFDLARYEVPAGELGDMLHMETHEALFPHFQLLSTALFGELISTRIRVQMSL